MLYVTLMIPAATTLSLGATHLPHQTRPQAPDWMSPPPRPLRWSSPSPLRPPLQVSNQAFIPPLLPTVLPRKRI
ncbi:hypothetical protein PR001_g10631 [Phytophthora rubi]|uniref:RxLR effector protein n=1 Tax=Phytophthora rubi TaxID=129364 RepID=A0A6A3M2K0_9STRA|nr:hypothetical protein PR002_g11123 [Phytophthora rubi]KAE9032408.1 hypothetical protein PR001_g10631 [Phytophthora rubi]